MRLLRVRRLRDVQRRRRVRLLVRRLRDARRRSRVRLVNRLLLGVGFLDFFSMVLRLLVDHSVLSVQFLLLFLDLGFLGPSLLLLRLLCFELLLFQFFLFYSRAISGLLNERLQLAVGRLLTFPRSARLWRLSLCDCLDLRFVR